MTSGPSAQAIVDQLKQARVEFVVNVPDRTTSRLAELVRQDPAFTFIPVCKEDEGVSICAALSFGDKRAVLLIQHTGLLDSVNAIRAVASENRQPLVLMVGLLAKEPGIKPTESARFGVKMAEPLLDILEIPHTLVEVSGDEAQIGSLIEEAYSTPGPTAILVGRETA